MLRENLIFVREINLVKRIFMIKSTERRITENADKSVCGPVRSGQSGWWTSADSSSNVILILSIILLLVATLITDVIQSILKPCLIWIIIDS